jgi:hypothetical protein
MCLELTAIPAEDGRVSAEALSKISGLTVTKTARPTRGAFRFSVGPGCSCSLLADTADSIQPTWALAPEVLEGLAKAVDAIAGRAKGLTFQALWIGDTPETSDHVRLKELLRTIRGNAVRNKHVYRVGKVG